MKEIKTTEVNGIQFAELDDSKLIGSFRKEIVEAWTIAAAGRHNLIFTGTPGCGKTLLLQSLPLITPLLTPEEAEITSRIWSLAGLLNPGERLQQRPFRMPHYTATVDGIAGGGYKCMPGEISLAHNGTLFLDEASEFRWGVLQILRVPVIEQHITIARLGRQTVYPAHFQLIMDNLPCPCGNFGVSKHICLCSRKSVEEYWKKIPSPLMDRLTIRMRVEPGQSDTVYDLNKIRRSVANAYRAQRVRGVYNEDMRDIQLIEFCKMTDGAKAVYECLPEEELTTRDCIAVLKLSRTVADMNERELITEPDIRKAVSLRKTKFAEL